MSMTDPIADFLSRIRNGLLARKAVIDCPRSVLKSRIADVLKQEGYLDGIKTVETPKDPLLRLTLRYDETNQAAITGVRRVSRPGQRNYVGHKDVPRVRNGLGVAILSTSQGIMTDREARKRGVGGEVLCEVW